MTTLTFTGETSKASTNLGKTLVSKGDRVVVESFLQDKPVPFVDVPEEEAEVRIGAQSDFTYNIIDKQRVDSAISGPTVNYGGTTWPDPPSDKGVDPQPPTKPTDPNDPWKPQDPNGGDPDEQTSTIILEYMEASREVETIRVMGNDNESWVDIQRIKSITFKDPEASKPEKYYKLLINWANPVIVDQTKNTDYVNPPPNDVGSEYLDATGLDLGPGDKIVNVENAP